MTVEQILFQAGMVGAFIVYAILQGRLNTREREHRDEQWRDFIQTQNANMLGFLDRERDQRREIMGTAYKQFSENMDRLAEGMGELTKAMGDHDANAQVRHDRIANAIKKINGE